MSPIATHERMLVSRYLMPGRAGRFVLLIAAIGCAGIAIGVAALVLVVSFMNGAEAQLGGQIASADGHVFVTRRGALQSWSGVGAALAHDAEVSSATPSAERFALVSSDGRTFGVDLKGLDPASMGALPIFDPRSAGLLGRAPREAGSVALGSELAAQLGVTPGSSVAITVPRFVDGQPALDEVAATVVGIVDTGVHAFDSRRVVMPVGDVASLVKGPVGIDKVSIRLARPDRQGAFAASLAKRLGPRLAVRTWQDMNRTLVSALLQERVAMTVIISLVTLVALLNITSSMVMLVRHKAREIAILRTAGMSRGSVARVFVLVGVAIGVAGEVAGFGIGFALKAAKDPVVGALRARMTHPPVELDVLLAMPLTISPGEVGWIAALVSIGIVLSTWHPAVRAAAVDPASALRYG